MHTSAHQARTLWPAFETVHATVYFAPEAIPACKALGLKGGWMGYFATRAAAMGAAPPGLVTAVFYNFHPAMVHRALPEAWALATPEEVLTTRLEVVDAALRRLLPDHLGLPTGAGCPSPTRWESRLPRPDGGPGRRPGGGGRPSRPPPGCR